jgi:choice-of-anchor A domain-containing protein
VEGPVAGGRDIAIQEFSYNTSASGSIGALAGRNFTGTSGNVQRDLVYGNALSLNNVRVLQGTSRKATPIDFLAEKSTLDLLSTNLSKYPVNGTTAVSQNGTVFSFTGTDPLRNVFSVNGAALAAADQFSFSVPATSTVIVNVTGTAAVFETSSIVLGALTSNRLVWNFPQTTTLRVSQTGFKGTLLATNAAVTQTNSSLEGVLIAGSATGNNTGITWLPFDGALTSCSNATLAVAPGSPQLAGTLLALSATATCVDNLAPEFHFDYFNASTDATWHEVAPGFSTGAVPWNTNVLPAGTYQVRVVVRRAGETTLSGASATTTFVLDNPVTIPTNVATVQDFNGLGTGAVNSLASGWRIDKQSNPRTLGTYAAATYKTDFRAGALLPAAAGNGIYNFGTGVANPQAAIIG